MKALNNDRKSEGITLESIVKMHNINKSFWSVEVLHNVNFEVAKGEVHVLVGANGAGKSTLIKILSGAISNDSGDIIFDNVKFNVKTPMEARNSGVSTIYQELTLVPELTVSENIFLGREILTNGFMNRKKMREESLELLSNLKVSLDPDKKVKHLGIGEQYMVEIAKSLFMKAKLVILDEPTTAMTSLETKILFDVIVSLKKEGVSFIYISHHLEEIFEIGDRVTVMRDGKVIETQNISEINQDMLIEKMLGKVQNSSYQKGMIGDETVLQVEDLNVENKLNGISFELKKGEVLGVTGLLGAGKTELANTLIGTYKIKNGKISLNKKELKLKNPLIAIENGIGLVPEDRKHLGLITEHSIRDNIGLCNLDLVLSNSFISRKKEDELVNKLINSLSIKTTGPGQLVKSLSGGNQQKVVLAKWLARDCNVLILDEPTRGVDVGAKEEIYKLIEDLKKKGVAIIITSSEFSEVITLSDRIMVLRKGSISKILNSVDASIEKVAKYAEC